MTSKRIFEAKPMNFRFNMYDHDYYHSLSVQFTFNITYQQFNELHIDEYDMFKRNFITSISAAAFVNPSAIHVQKSENALTHAFLFRRTLEIEMQFPSDMSEQIESLNAIINSNLTYDSSVNIFSSDGTTLCVYIAGYDETQDIQGILLQEIPSIQSVQLNNCNLVTISAVIHHINRNDLLYFQHKIHNELTTIFPHSFVSDYSHLLFAETEIVTHQHNSHTEKIFDVVMHFDWVKKFNEVYNDVKNHYQKTEEFRSGVFKPAYNDFEAVHVPDTENGKTSKEQWAEHLEIILHETIFRHNPMLKNVIRITPEKVELDLAFQEKVDTHTHDKLLLKNISQSYRYSTKYLGNLINNHNVEEIMVQLHAHGYFYSNIGENSEPEYMFNPPVEKVDSELFPLYMPISDNDEIVFPVTISSIYGYSDDISIHSNDDIYNPYVSMYTIHIRCVQKTEST